MTDFVRSFPLTSFFILAYAISWAGVSPLVLSGAGLIDAAVPSSLHAFGAFGPVLAALIVTRLVDGRSGLRDIGARLRWVGVGGAWKLLAIASPFGLLAISLLIVRGIQGVWPPWGALFSELHVPEWWLDLAIAAVAYGFGEEIGWRGFALPRLQYRHNAFIATLVLAFWWALWHAPFFFYRFPWGGPVMIPGFFVGLFAGAVWFTFLFNSSRGCILIVALWHVCWNVVNVVATNLSQDALAAMSSLVIVLAVLAIVVGKPSYLNANGPHVIDRRSPSTQAGDGSR